MSGHIGNEELLRMIADGAVVYMVHTRRSPGREPGTTHFDAVYALCRIVDGPDVTSRVAELVRLGLVEHPLTDIRQLRRSGPLELTDTGLAALGLFRPPKTDPDRALDCHGIPGHCDVCGGAFSLLDVLKIDPETGNGFPWALCGVCYSEACFDYRPGRIVVLG